MSFRRAYADDPLEISIPDQLPSLLLAAGGRPHRSPTFSADGLLWTVGVDLAHHQKKETSTLALTLVDSDGLLISAWTKEQPLDETARVKTLSTLLKQCRHRLGALKQTPRVVVLRDGRMFENEESALYEEILGTPVSLFEFRKRGNPQIIYIDQKKSPIDKPIAVQVPETTTMFLVTSAPRNKYSLPFVSKVTWNPQWNSLGLTPLEISTILTASAAAPGLGIQPRLLPAAIYWADGIAGASNDDLRFRGLPVTRASAGEIDRY